MTKQQFIEEFLRHFADISQEEREQITDYYEELICDGLEQGKSEEECVAAFGDPAEAAAWFRRESGMAERSSIPPKNEGKPQTYQPNGSIHTIDLKAENLRIEIRPVTEPDSPVRVLFTPIEERDEVYTEEKDGVFYFRHKTKRKIQVLKFFLWRRHESPVIILEVPASFEGNLRVQTCNSQISMTGLQKLYQTVLISSNGAIQVEDTSSTRLSLKTSNSPLTLTNIGAIDVEGATSNGPITAVDINCTTIQLASSNSSLRLDNLIGEEIQATTSNSPIGAGNCKGSRKIFLKTSNGNIYFENCETPDMWTQTSNSPIQGTIIGDIREYAIESHTSNGPNNLPNIQYPNCTKRFYAKTSNGRIDVQFVLPS